jgi:competence protein ComEA
MEIKMKKAVFPLLSLAFIISCAIFVYLARESTPVYVNVIVPIEETDVGRDALGTPVADNDAHIVPQIPATPALVNINTASLEELMTLQGVGPAIGQRIIDYREENGLFMAIEEFMDVPGIGEATFGNLKDKITIGS